MLLRKTLLLFILCGLNQLIAQQKTDLGDIYIEDSLAYKISDNLVFSGQAQKIRKNGHLVYEEYYKNGTLNKTVLYFNNTERPIPATITDFYSSLLKKKEVNYDMSGSIIKINYYNQSGYKTLIEEFQNDKLIYSCEYLQNKKHGKEFCYNKNGEAMESQFENGKRINEN